MSTVSTYRDSSIAIVGAGKGGAAILNVLLQIPGVKVKYVCDINPSAEGVILAKKHNIRIITELRGSEIVRDRSLNLIFEATGNRKIYEYLQENADQRCTVLGAVGARVLFYLLESQQKITEELKHCKTILSEKVMERTEELEKSNMELQNKINEYQELNRKLQQINDEKTRYLVNATHQLKAPFAAIQSYSELLLEGYADTLSPKAEEIVTKIRDRCLLLSKSIREMLELANLNSFVEENLEITRENLNSIVEKTIEGFTPAAEVKNIRIRFNPEMEKILIPVNRKQIEALVHILLENAVNYSPENSDIDVITGKTDNGKPFLAVRDRGIGIEEKNLKNIFKEYFRTNRAVRQSRSGSGLGLAIAKRIAELHRADITVDSTAGKGSVFTVEFPR